MMVVSWDDQYFLFGCIGCAIEVVRWRIEEIYYLLFDVSDS